MFDGLIAKRRIRQFGRFLFIFLIIILLSRYIPPCQLSYTASFTMGALAAIALAVVDIYFPLI